MVVYSDVTGWVEALAANQELVSNVSHEFKTPLNSIIGNIDLVLDDAGAELPPQVAQRLLVVQRNAERLAALVSDLTANASTALNVHPKRTDLASLVETSLGSAQAQAERARIELRADVPSPLWAYADPLRIGQALDNLVSNAIKYSPDGGTVSVSASFSEEWVRLSVSDTGMGMSSEDTARVFKRFFRTEICTEGGHFRRGAGPVHHQDDRGGPRRHHHLRERPGTGQHVHADAPGGWTPAVVLALGPLVLPQRPCQFRARKQLVVGRVGHFLQHQRMRRREH